MVEDVDDDGHPVILPGRSPSAERRVADTVRSPTAGVPDRALSVQPFADAARL